MTADQEIGTETTAAKGVGAPRWATQPFADLVKTLKHLQQLLNMSVRGIAVFQAFPQMVRAVALAEDRVGHDDTVNELKQAELSAAFAEQEIKDGFPVLHSHTALSTWSHLEATLRLFIAHWLENEPGAIRMEAVQKLKVRIGDYESLDGQERYFYIVDRLEQETAAPLKSGISRFEVLLEPFGLAGCVADGVKKDLFELNQIRNNLLHRAGRADRRLLDACPWLEYEPGQHVRVTSVACDRYISSALHYALGLVCRIGEKYGVKMSEVRHNRENVDVYQ